MKTVPVRLTHPHAGMAPGWRRTSALEGGELDAIVSRIEGVPFVMAYSRHQDIGGLIVDREGIVIEARRDGEHFNGRWLDGAHFFALMPGSDTTESGLTALVAAMRAYVAKKLGTEIDLSVRRGAGF